MTIGPLLSIEGLRVGVGDSPDDLLKGVSLVVERGKTLAVVGESGSGKSLTSLAVMGLLPNVIRKRAGSIRFDGSELPVTDNEAMRKIRGKRIGMVFQEPMAALNPVYSIGGQVAEVILEHEAVSRAEAMARAVELLDLVHLPDPARIVREYPHRLSGGQRQRVCIAMALACRPELLIADEPTTALDVTVQAQIMRLLDELQDRMGIAILLITHNLGLVAQTADRVAVMYQGRVVEDAPTRQIFTDPKDPYTRALLAATPRPGARRTDGPPLAEMQSVTADRPAEPKAEKVPARARLSRPSVPDGSRQPDSPVLSIRDLHCSFETTRGTVHAVRGVTLDLLPGETLALVGESGCGKTTLARCVLGLQRPTSGEILLGGESLVGLSRRAARRHRPRMQCVFQDPFASLNPRKRVKDLIREPLDVNGVGTSDERSRQVAELMERVGLRPEWGQRFPHEFSGGQRQRICIARALALHPDVLICDEPVSALDVSVQAQVVNLLWELQRDLGLSYLFITHDLLLVENFADRVAMISQGKIVEEGRAVDVWRNPRHAFTRTLIDAIPIPDPDVPMGSAHSVFGG